MTVPANPKGAVSSSPDVDTAAGVAPDEHTKDSLAIRGLIFARDRGLFVLFVLLIIAFSIWASPFFAKWSNAVLIANAAALTAVYAAGVAVGAMAGSLDISIPGTAALAGVVCGKMLTGNNPVWLGIAVALAVGVLVGVANGLIT